MPKSSFVTTAVLLQIAAVHGHSRFGCPAPRSPDTNIKTGPCGASPPGAPTLTLAPGPFTVEIEESIAHTGAPFKITLSGDGDDATGCVLIDHIPSNPASTPSFGNEATYTKYYIT